MVCCQADQRAKAAWRWSSLVKPVDVGENRYCALWLRRLKP